MYFFKKITYFNNLWKECAFSLEAYNKNYNLNDDFRKNIIKLSVLRLK